MKTLWKKSAIIALMLLLPIIGQFSSLKIVSANPSSMRVWSPPELAILSPLQNATYSSNVPLNLKVTTYMKGWSAETLMSISYSLDGKPDVTLPSLYGYDPTDDIVTFVNDRISSLNDGQHTVTFHGLTNWHNSFSATVNFTVNTSSMIWDNDAPKVSIISPKNETYTYMLYTFNRIPLNFSVNRLFVWAKLSLDGEANRTVNGNTIEVEYGYGNYSYHNVTVYVIDPAGNIGVSETIYFATIEPAFPSPPPLTIKIVSPQNSTSFRSDVPLTFLISKTSSLDIFSSKSVNISQITFSLDGQAEVMIRGNTTLTEIPNGMHNITVYAKDTQGDMGFSKTIFFAIVKTEPFPIINTAVISVTTVAIILSGIFVYWKKTRH
jgi:hypothetical protein